MVLVDLIVVVFVSFYAVMGFYWGAIRQLIAVTSVVAAFVVVGRTGIGLSHFIALMTKNEQLALIGAVLIILLLINGTASLGASIIQQRYGLIAFGVVDHGLGAFLAVIQALVTLVGLILVSIAYPVGSWHDMLVQSSGVKILIYFFGGAVLSFIPEPLQSALRVVVYR
ncbi:MAG: hypothetical protein RLY87_975 [Chloroflexota bacterium]|jgi:uncharacterized membrane protein required for colicin V production